MYLNNLCISDYLCIVGSVICVLVVVVYWYRCGSACVYKIKKKKKSPLLLPTISTGVGWGKTLPIGPIWGYGESPFIELSVIYDKEQSQR